VNPALVNHMWPTPGTFSLFTTLWKKSNPARSSRETEGRREYRCDHFSLLLAAN
jgi:hypothetical protein